MGWTSRPAIPHPQSISPPARNLLETGDPHRLNLAAQGAPMPAGSASLLLLQVSPLCLSPLQLGHRKCLRPNRKAGLHICSDYLPRMSAKYVPAITEVLMGNTLLGLFKYL